MFEVDGALKKCVLYKQILLGAAAFYLLFMIVGKNSLTDLYGLQKQNIVSIKGQLCFYSELCWSVYYTVLCVYFEIYIYI